MENKTSTLELLLEKIEAYGKTSFELYKCQAIATSSEVISNLAAKLVFIVLIMLALFMINIGVAFWIGDLLNKTYYGFFVVALFYIIVGVVCYLLRRELIKTPISNSIIKSFLK